MTDHAVIKTDKLNLAYCRIVSPVTGRVGLRLVDAGNYVQVGCATALVVVTQLQPITVIFVLPEDDVPAVSQQLATGAQLQVSAWDRDNAMRSARGTLLTIDNTVDTTTGAVKLRASFPNQDFALFPNQFVNARLTLQTLSGVTIVSEPRRPARGAGDLRLSGEAEQHGPRAGDPHRREPGRPDAGAVGTGAGRHGGGGRGRPPARRARGCGSCPRARSGRRRRTTAPARRPASSRRTPAAASAARRRPRGRRPPARPALGGGSVPA